LRHFLSFFGIPVVDMSLSSGKQPWLHDRPYSLQQALQTMMDDDMQKVHAETNLLTFGTEYQSSFSKPLPDSYNQQLPLKFNGKDPADRPYRSFFDRNTGQKTKPEIRKEIERTYSARS